LIRESEDLPSRIWNFTLADIGLPFGRIENGIPETSEQVSGIFILREVPLINGLKIVTTSKIVIPVALLSGNPGYSQETVDPR